MQTISLKDERKKKGLIIKEKGWIKPESSNANNKSIRWKKEERMDNKRERLDKTRKF